MPYFRVRTQDAMGDERTRLMLAASTQDVRRQVARDGLATLSITTVSERKAKHRWPKHFGATMLRAIRGQLEFGTPLGDAVKFFVNSATSPTLRAAMQPMLDRLNRGGRFSEAVAELGLLPPPAMALITAGDAAGQVLPAISDALEYLEIHMTVVNKSSLTLVAIGLEMTGVVSAFFMAPAAIDMVSKGDPAAQESLMLQAASVMSYVGAYGSVAAALFIASVAAAYDSNSKALRSAAEKVMHRLPPLRAILVDGTLATTLKVAGSLIGGRQPLTRSLQLAKGESKTPIINEFWSTAIDRLQRGHSVRHAFAAEGLLQSTEIQAIAAHQSVKQLGSALVAISQYRHDSYVAGWERLAAWTKNLFWISTAYVVVIGGFLLVAADDSVMNTFAPLMK